MADKEKEKERAALEKRLLELRLEEEQLKCQLAANACKQAECRLAMVK